MARKTFGYQDPDPKPRTVEFELPPLPGRAPDGADKMTRSELADLAEQRGLKVGAKTTKAQLLAALSEGSDEPDVYTATLGKVGGLVITALAGGDDADRAVTKWLQACLGDQWGRIEARLQDPNDPFDMADLGEVSRWLVREASNRPTQRRRG